MIGLWPVFTALHGPTSLNEDGTLLGLDAEFWGSMMEGPSLLLVALGLAGARDQLLSATGRAGRVGLWLAVVALALPALVNVAILAVVPPLLSPLLGVGLVLVAARCAAEVPGLARAALAGIALLAFFSFAWTALVRPDVIDEIHGYRIYGVGANVLSGLGWILLAVSLVAGERARTAGPGVASPS